jgi:lysophospholipase L1-like esterase
VQRRDWRFWRILAIVGVNAALTAVLLLAVDFAVSRSRLLYRVVPNSFRIADPHIRNTLAADVDDGIGWWDRAYPVRTNSLGLRDAVVRTVARRTDKAQRVLFIGDSFTEGVGLPWEETFVGLFAARFPGIEVLNAATVGYSPSMYWKKTVRLLDAGYRVDHVVVYIDISDVQDETLTQIDGAGDIHDGPYLVDPFARTDDPPTSIQTRLPPDAKPRGAWEEVWYRNFRVSRFWLRQAQRYVAAWWQPAGGTIAGREVDKLVRSMWTIPGVALPLGYGDIGVEGGIAKEIAAMDALTAALRARGIRLSVAVYPWPDQMAYDVAESRQVSIWRAWCARQGCAAFIDHFPDFLAHRGEADWRARFYIDHDVHFTAAGNRLLADRLVAAMAPLVSAPMAPGRD